jgi:CBS domain containing-hemolysin-like protein
VLAEVFGDFGDEFKEGQAQPEVLPDGRVRLPGLLPVEDAGAFTGDDWSGLAAGAHTDTVGGLVTSVMGRIPLPGEITLIGNSEVLVEAMGHNAVESILVTVPGSVENPGE